MLDLQAAKNHYLTRLKTLLTDPHSISPYDALNTTLNKTGIAVLNQVLRYSVPFAARNGFRIVEFDKGTLKAKIPLKGNKNHIGTMYAGAMFLLAEIPGGIFCIVHCDDHYYPILKDLKMEFLKVAKSDVTIALHIEDDQWPMMKSEADRHGKYQFILEGNLVDAQGKTVARSFATYQLRKKAKKTNKLAKNGVNP